MGTQHPGVWRARATHSSSSPAPLQTLAFSGRPALPSCTPVPTLSSRESLTPSMWVFSSHRSMRLTHIYCHRRNSEIWSVTTALRQRAGERGAWGAAASSTWTSSSSAAVPPALGRMEAAGSKVTFLWLSSFSTIVLCITQNEIVHCGLVMGRLKGRVKNWPFRIKGIVQFLLHNYTTNILISVTYYAVQSWVATIHIIKEMFMFCLHFLFHNICKKTQNKTKTNTVTSPHFWYISETLILPHTCYEVQQVELQHKSASLTWSSPWLIPITSALSLPTETKPWSAACWKYSLTFE